MLGKSTEVLSKIYKVFPEKVYNIASKIRIRNIGGREMVPG